MPDEIKFDLPVTSKEQEDALRKEREKKLWDSMKPHERVLHYADKRSKDPYGNLNMAIRFPDVRAITHFNGFILVIIDEKQAFNRAVKIATENQGPHATAVDIMQEAQRRAVKTTALPLKTFITNLRFISQFTTNSPYYTSLDASKKTELRDLLEDAMAAIRDAKKYRHHHPDEFMVENIRTEDGRLLSGEYPVQIKDFAITFGANWKSKLGDNLLNLLDINIYEE